MSLISCSACGNKISSHAKTCPQCGARNTKQSWGIGKKLVAGFFILWVGASVMQSVRRTHEDSAIEARRQKDWTDTLRYGAVKKACKDTVLTRLKAPSTSEFPQPIDVRSNKNDPTVYFVLGAVDAQNSFGAKLRQEYVCKLKAGADWDENTVTKVTVGRQ
jgi:hypothetical protein